MKNQIIVIGGANIDIQGFPNDKFVLRDSNPGKIKTSPGGVGRNIAENLARLGVSTKLISAIGSDEYGRRLLESAESAGIDMSLCRLSESEPTCVYLSLLDEQGDMIAALSQMELTESINVEFVRTHDKQIRESEIIVVDTNISEELLRYITDEYKDIPVILDTVSTAKAVKAREFIGNFHTVKPNIIEAETLSGIKYKKKSDIFRLEEFFLKKGVKRLYITVGGEGVFYSDGKSNGFLTQFPVKIVNATGAGDAFTAAVAFGQMKGFTAEDSACFARAAAVMALTHEDTINPDISEQNILNLMKAVSRNV